MWQGLDLYDACLELFNNNNNNNNTDDDDDDDTNNHFISIALIF